MNTIWCGAAVLTVVVAAATFGAEGASVVAEGAELGTLCSGFVFTEGPAADAEGNVFFTDQPNNRIWKLSVDGKLSVFLSPCGRSNGLFFDRQGNLWACADENNELWRIDPQGNITVVVKDYKGKKLNGPNDLWIAPNGGIYFTDPLYQRAYWTRGSMEQDGQHVYYLTADRKDLIRVTNDLVQPNGIIGTPDGNYLYVADAEAWQTYRYKVNPDGSLSEKKLFCGIGSDGMTIDAEGNLYLTYSGVTVFNAQGRLIESIPVPGSPTTNVTFGGKDRKTLFVTSQGGALYGLRMRVEGASITPDFNHDYKVDIQDLLELIQSWGQTNPTVDIAPPPFGDGVADKKDLEVLMSYWGKEIVDPALIAHWRLDETEGVVAHDSAGHNDATAIGVPLWQPEGGMVGGALELDGVDDCVTTNVIPRLLGSPFSVFAWIRGGAPGQVAISQKDGANWLGADPASGFLETGLRGTSRNGCTLCSETIITDGDWHRVGLVWDGTNRSLCVDDVAVAEDTQTGGFAYSSWGLNLGCDADYSPATFWVGLVDDVRIYDRAVTP